MSTFPPTHVSVIGSLESNDSAVRERAQDAVARAYRTPIVALLQSARGMSAADAEDVAHDFLFSALTKGWLSRFDRSRGRFRTFLRRCVLDFASTSHEAANRIKRGGSAEHVSLDAAASDMSVSPDAEALFDREWAKSVLGIAVETLRRECKVGGRESTFAIFVARDIDGAERDAPPTYADLATQFGIPPTQVTNYLNWARRRFRSIVLDVLRELTASEAEFRDEARDLLGLPLP